MDRGCWCSSRTDTSDQDEVGNCRSGGVLRRAGQVLGGEHRRHHPSDRRAILVELTDTGRGLAKALIADQYEFARFRFAG